MDETRTRRKFLLQGVGGISAAWTATHWPAAVAAALHARGAMQSSSPTAFEFFTTEMAAEIEAAAARIVPTNDTPGAREAGVVCFIDRALMTFTKNDQELYHEGLKQLQARTRELYPTIPKFSSATPEQQDEILRSLDTGATQSDRPFRPGPEGQGFFETLRQHTILGFLIDPDADRRGNKDGVGWRVIGREREHMFRPPYGHYDAGYRGWEQTQTEPENK